MIKPRLILCGGVPASEQLRDGRHVVSLSTNGTHKNVNVQVQDVARVFGQNLPSRLQDLLEIVTYLYSADCATGRGVDGKWGDEDSLEPWQRDFRVVIPVRNVDFWSSSVISQTLRDTLQFLSDDQWDIHFTAIENSARIQDFFEFGDNNDWPFQGVDRVSMFSGGLDSLAGAIQRASEHKNLVLISHRPNTIQDSRQRNLVSALKSKLQVPIIHVPVFINKDDAMKEVAAEKKVPLVDLHAASFALFEELGDAGSTEFSPSASDRTHFSRKGAKEIAKLVAQSLPLNVPALRVYQRQPWQVPKE